MDHSSERRADALIDAALLAGAPDLAAAGDVWRARAALDDGELGSSADAALDALLSRDGSSVADFASRFARERATGHVMRLRDWSEPDSDGS